MTPLCKEHSIPFLWTDDINTPDSLNWIRGVSPDIIFCFGWSQLIKRELLNIPESGVIGFHPAALPQNRGRHPLIWALALGLDRTASTFFFMDEGADSGDILSQRYVQILYEDNAGTLYEKITRTALEQIEEFIPRLEKKSFRRVPQNHSKANIWRKRAKADGKIDFRMSSRSVYNLVRALTKPYIGAHIEYRGKEIKIWAVKEIPLIQPNTEPGKVLNVRDNTFTVKTSDGSVLILEHEFETLPCIGEYL